MPAPCARSLGRIRRARAMVSLATAGLITISLWSTPEVCPTLSAASRARSPCLLRAGCGAARRLERLVPQPAFSADRSRRVEHPAKRLVDRIVRRKGRSDFRLEQDQVASLAQSRDVLATDTA